MPRTTTSEVRRYVLQFLSEWLARGPVRLGACLAEFAGHPAYGLDELRGELERFTFLLGGSDGESLSGPAQREMIPAPSRQARRPRSATSRR